MRLGHISIQNIRKRKTHSVLLIMSVLIGVASVVFLYTTSEALKWDLANKIDEFGPNMLILPDTEKSMTFAGITLQSPKESTTLNSSIINLMKTIENKETLATISPKLLSTDTIKEKKVLLVGIQFADELRLKKWWKIDAIHKEMPKAYEVLLGQDAANTLNLGLNDSVTIKNRTFRIAGIIRSTGSPENDETIFMDLNTLQSLTNQTGKISLIEAAVLCYTCPIAEVTQQLQDKLPQTQVIALKSALESRDSTVQKFNIFAWSISAILIIASALIIGITLKSSVEERTKEIGILKAIGFRKTHIIKIFLLEAIILSIIGSFLGYFIGMGLAVHFGGTAVNIQVQVTWQPILLLYSLIASLIITIISSSYPSWRASQLNPTDALRYI